MVLAFRRSVCNHGSREHNASRFCQMLQHNIVKLLVHPLSSRRMAIGNIFSPTFGKVRWMVLVSVRSSNPDRYIYSAIHSSGLCAEGLPSIPRQFFAERTLRM